MHRGATYAGKQHIVICALFGSLVGILGQGAVTWASTRFGPDIEVQAWYRMRHTFQTDGNEHFDWVQWRNEAFVWLVYNNIVQNGTLRPFDLGWRIPFVENLAVSARYRARVDPVYYLREHYRNLYDSELRSNWFNPERDFRDLYADIDHGELGFGRLSSRWGYQQIVWGESDLFRSLDIINPLRIDQNALTGEKFDEFRFPILAVKFLYDIGTVGEWLSGVAIESWYTPRMRLVNNHVLVEDGWRIPFQMRGCQGTDGRLVPYSVENCKDSRRFLPQRPGWLPWRRMGHPWSLVRVGPNARLDSPDFACVAGTLCRPDVVGESFSVLYNIGKGRGHHHPRGTDPGLWSSGGVRLLAKTYGNVDFSLNYMFIRTGVFGLADPKSAFADSWGNLRPDIVYGDFGIIPDGQGGVLPPAGSFEEGLRRCLSPTGKTNDGGGRQLGGARNATMLTGADLRGYDWPERRLDANGNPLPGAQRHARRLPMTFCSQPQHRSLWTHVMGFTLTYNDFDYTGAVFRVEQSVSTKEGRFPIAPGSPNPRIINGQPADEAPFGKLANEAFKNHLLKTTWVWRSMLGFDLAQSFASLRGMNWTRHLPGQIGTQQSFITFQWLMEYQAEAIANNAWHVPESTGRPGIPAPKNFRWNHLLTLGVSGQGYFRSKLEQRLAVAYEPRGKQYLLYGQWWWRNFFSLPVDLSMGTSWFPGSKNDISWSLLNYYVGRNLLWFEATYYLL